METGWFTFNRSVLFDLGCINVLKNLKCLGKLKSDNIPFMAKSLLSPLGTVCTADGPEPLTHTAASPFPTWNPHPSQSHRGCQAPSALEQGLSCCSQVSGARWMAGHSSQQRLALWDPHERSRSRTELGGSGTNPMDREPSASPSPRAESFSCVGDEVTAMDTSSKKHQVHFYYSLRLCLGSFCRGAKPWWWNTPAHGFSKRKGEESRVPWVRNRGCGAMQPLCQAAGDRLWGLPRVVKRRGTAHGRSKPRLSWWSHEKTEITTTK